MHNLRAYYSATINDFLRQSAYEILGCIHMNDMSAETSVQQNNSWQEEIVILKEQLRDFREGCIIFEYTIPRMGKRVDTIILHANIVFLLEFKIGDTEYRASTYDQVYDYALDLCNFHKESHDKLIVPIMVSSNAMPYDNELCVNKKIVKPLRCNADNLGKIIRQVVANFQEMEFDYWAWEHSEYLPTPTIIEAAQVLYRGHNVQDITRSDAGAENLTVTTKAVNQIIEASKKHHKNLFVL